MAGKPVQFTIPKDADPFELKITKFAGVNKYDTPTEVADNEFTDAVNIQLVENGLPDKRYGYERVYETSLGIGGINGAYKGIYKGKIVFSWGTALYTQAGTNQPVQILTGLANAKSYFFALNDILFMVNGTDFVYYNGTTAGTVASIAYIPTTVIGRLPAGGGTTFEAVNLMQPGRKNSFIGDAGAAEVVSLYISSVASANGNLSITLDGVTTNVAILTTDTINGIASKVRATSFTGWTISGVADEVIFTANAAGVKTDATFNSNATGVLGDIYTTTQGTAPSTVYYLDTTGIDSTTVTAIVAGVAKTEGVDFTVDRTLGTVTFSVAPPNGNGIDNVIITFYKTVSGYADKIVKCNIQPVLFGGNNDSRAMLATGNVRYHSGLYDGTYWPDLNYTKIGSDQNAITAFSQKDDTQIILKQQNSLDTTIWGSRYNIDSNGNVTYPIFPINGMAGSDAKCTEIILNNPVFLDKSDGIYWINATNVKDQRAVERLSDKINKDLLAEANKENAISFLWQFRYGICLNNNVYVYDFRLNAWYGKWTNIKASCFMQIERDLYFTSNETGMVYKFQSEFSNINSRYNDDGYPIECYIYTKQFAYGKDNYKKLLSRIFYGLKPLPRSAVTVSYTTNINSVPTTLPKTRRDLYDYSLFDYSKFSYATSLFPQASMKKVRVKKFVWIQFEYKNNELDSAMPLLSTTYQYIYQNIVKDQ